MSVDREKLKRMIDQMNEEDTVEVFDFIGYLNVKRERELLNQIGEGVLSNDEELIRQVQRSRQDRENGQIYSKEEGLKYLAHKIRDFEHGQNL